MEVTGNIENDRASNDNVSYPFSSCKNKNKILPGILIELFLFQGYLFWLHWDILEA